MRIKKFLKDLTERAVKTGAQVAVATIGVSVTIGEVNWGVLASTVALAMILSALTSIASKGDTDSASLINKV